MAQQHAEAWPRLRERHDALMHQIVQAHNGHVFQIVGDEFCSAFHTALDAVLATVDLQRALQQEPWSPVTIKVRMGLHSGTARSGGVDDRTGGYTGYTALASTERVMSSGYGGQILLSNATAELARADLPEGVLFIDMGEHRLKGLFNVQHLWQVYAEGLEREFPPLKSLNAIPNNLPLQLTAFIGRDLAIRDLHGQLADHRLITLTGPGGTGKTRLALEVGARELEAFPDGVWFVELASISEPSLVPQTVASTLGIREQPGLTAQQTLMDYLDDRRLLILLDNCEHLLAACAQLSSELLHSAAQLKLLATSREPLHIGGERVYPVQSLSVPDQAALPAATDLDNFEASRLFVDRALDAQPALEFDDASARTVGEICRQLDGIPFAIELAAARTRTLSVDAIAERLADRFQLLSRGDRTAVPRQRTLRALLDWSYDLLSVPECRLLARLSVFRNGWRLESAEAVGSGPGVETADVLDLLSSLVDKSLVTLNIGSGRYNMLETVRQYGLEKLVESGEAEDWRRKHAVHFCSLVNVSPDHTRNYQGDWLARLEDEHDNLRAAVHWAVFEAHDTELSLRLVGAVASFWVVRGYLREGFANAMAVLDQTGESDYPELRLKVTLGAGWLAYRQNNLADARRLYSEGLEMARQLDDPIRTAEALLGLGNASTEVGDYETATARFREARELSQAEGDRRGMADADMNMAWAVMRTGDTHSAVKLLLDALQSYEAAGYQTGVGFCLSGLGEAYLRQGELDRAVDTLKRSLAIREALRDKWGMGATLGSLGWAYLDLDDIAGAREALRRSLQLREEIGDKGGMAWCLEKLAETSAKADDPEAAVRLYGAARALRESIGSVIDPADQPAYEERLEQLEAKLGEKVYTARWNEGIGTSRQSVIANLLAGPAAGA